MHTSSAHHIIFWAIFDFAPISSLFLFFKKNIYLFIWLFEVLLVAWIPDIHESIEGIFSPNNWLIGILVIPNKICASFLLDKMYIWVPWVKEETQAYSQFFLLILFLKR